MWHIEYGDTGGPCPFEKKEKLEERRSIMMMHLIRGLAGVLAIGIVVVTGKKVADMMCGNYEPEPQTLEDVYRIQARGRVK